MKKPAKLTKRNCCLSYSLLLPIVISLTLILVIMLSLIILIRLNSGKAITTAPKLNSSNESINIVGVIRTNGLSIQEKRNFGIDGGNYQITDLKNLKIDKNQIYGYFLEVNNTRIEKLLGKCVNVKGSVKPGWDKIPDNNFQYNQKYTYQNSILILSQITQLDYNECKPYQNDNTQNISDQNNFRTYRGIIKHINRPSPDINYDYEIVLSEYTKEMYGSTGIVMDIKRIDITPFNNAIWEEMEKRAGKVLTVEGYKTWGYAESQYLLVTKIF